MNKLMSFYTEGFLLTGRRSLVSRAKVDTAEVAAKVGGAAPKDLFASIRQLAAKEASVLNTSKERNRWVRDNDDEIRDAGADPDAAYGAFMQGQEDALAFELIRDVTDTLYEESHDAEGDEEEDEEEDDDEEEEDDDKDIARRPS